MELVLYRVKIMRPLQSNAFDPGLSAPQLLRQMLLEKPTAPSSFGSLWHIGNVDLIDGSGVYFALGRTTRATIPILLKGSGDFVEEQYESAPYTHAFVDIEREVIAIAVKSSVAPTTDAMARQLERLLVRTNAARDADASVSVAAVSEPEQLLQALRTAYAVTSFTVHFTRPNPMDVNDEFIKPMERLALAAGGESGKTTIRGRALDPVPLTDLVRSAASSGDDAVANVKPARGSKSVRRSLRGQNARISEQDASTAEGRARILEKLRRKYSDVRGSDS